ncbi:ras-related protein Rab-32-like [Periplaneta americana]|uniref:ras-related protein Rab-32-like n=1 Tax=Periplaneta americana TaxID=6978 RepID=UPI0037E7FF27
MPEELLVEGGRDNEASGGIISKGTSSGEEGIEKPKKTSDVSVTITASNSATSVLEIADDVPTFKVLVVGNAGTGKTSLALRYVHKYKGITKPAVGYDFFLKSVKVGDKTVMKMELWDLPGSDRSALLTRTMYRKTDGVMIVFDITKRNTLADVLWWKEDINRKLIAMNKTVPFILVGNKCDLRKLNDESIEELRAYSTASGFDGFFLTSAKDNIEVSAAFDSLANMMLDRMVKAKIDQEIITLHKSRREFKFFCCW